MTSGRAVFSNDLGWREVLYWHIFSQQNYPTVQRRSFCFWLGTEEIDRDDRKYRALHERFR